MKLSRLLARGLAFAVLALLLPGSAPAQTAASSGQIVGQVLDPTGAVVTGAEVSVRNVDTNLSRRTTTDGSGRYAVSLLPGGPYQVTVSGSGLETLTRETLVTVGGTATVNLVMTVAGLAEDVMVSAPSITAAGEASKSVLTALQVQNLPASGRRVRGLFQLTPATQIEPECGGFSVSGQKGTMINLNLDGGDTTNTHWCGHVEISPTIGLEALQELQVLRSTFSAEFGRSTGGIVSMTTRSGTNQFRGTAYHLFRNDALTKLDPLGREQIDLSQQFGGSFGGPVARDRTFFFVSPEFQRNTKPVQTLYAALDGQGCAGRRAPRSCCASHRRRSTRRSATRRRSSRASTIVSRIGTTSWGGSITSAIT